MLRKSWVLGALLATVVATPLPQASAAGETVAVNFVSLTIPFYVFMRKEAEKRGERSASLRIGYIRQGQKVPVIPEAHPKSNCKEGWYELADGVEVQFSREQDGESTATMTPQMALRRR